MNYLPDQEKCKVAIIGMGYVGLPLAIEFAKKKKSLRSPNILNRKVVGYDVNKVRIKELRQGVDRTREISKDLLLSLTNLELNDELDSIVDSDVFIVTVPTPLNKDKSPNLKPIEEASKAIANALNLRDKKKYKSLKTPIIIYESTVYPGLTEEFCVPIIESISKQKLNVDFYCGYSPERINPGDKNHKLTTIKKVTSGSCEICSNWIDDFYGSIITAGTHKAESIKVAEAAKVIENTQRDLNIALVNELSIIFKTLGINTNNVLKAAETKWNFLPFRPGLVGGHCIGIDPYYLTYKSELMGYTPNIVLAGRKINDDMPRWIAEQIIFEMTRKKIVIHYSNVLIMGFTFKENCPDIRNTKTYDLIKKLKEYNIKIKIYDPNIDKKEALDIYGLEIENYLLKDDKFDALVITVAHKEFLGMTKEEYNSLLKDNGFIYDLKNIKNIDESKKINI